jgi:hypothetical protein
MFDFSGLINAILRRKSDDPVGNLKSATVWVHELPLADVHQAHVEIVKALASINENRRMPLKERIRVVMYLDEKARGLQTQLCRDFMAVIDTPHAPERAYLQTILTFWEEMANAYQICVRSFAQAPSNKLWPSVPTLTARGIHHFAMQAKWAHLRYLPVESAVWRNLNRLCLFADREGFAATPLKLFPDAEGETSSTAEYMHAMLLQLANPESLQPAQIDQVDRWLDHWAKTVLLEQEFRPHRQLYAVNLGDTKPARKLRRNMLGEKYRYFGVGLLMVTIDKTVEQLKAGEVPARLGLGEDCRLPHCLDLIELVQKRWARKDDTRKHERTARVKVVQVVQGFHDVVSQLKPGPKKPRKARPAGETIDYEVMGHTIGGTPLGGDTRSGEEDLFEPLLEQWVMENESASGCGATLEVGAQPLKIGTLVGLKPDSNRHFLIGVVRRINKNPAAKTYVGIETLSQAPIPVELHTLPNGQQKPLRTDGIYLLEAPEAQQPRSLLIARQEYEPGRILQLKAQGKAYSIRLQQALEQSDDYSRVSFDVLARHHA